MFILIDEMQGDTLGRIMQLHIGCRFSSAGPGDDRYKLFAKLRFARSRLFQTQRRSRQNNWAHRRAGMCLSPRRKREVFSRAKLLHGIPNGNDHGGISVTGLATLSVAICHHQTVVGRRTEGEGQGPWYASMVAAFATTCTLKSSGSQRRRITLHVHR